MKLKTVSPLLFVLVWYGVKAASGNPYLPYPHDVITGFFRLLIQGDDRGITLVEHSAVSLLRVFSGFALAGVLAIPLGILVGTSQTARELLELNLEMLRPIPPIAWIPIIIILLGSGLLGQSVIVFVGAFFPIFLNTVRGVKDTRKVLKEAAMTLGATRTDVVTKVIIPSSVPSIFTGLKVGLGVGWMCIVAAEMMGLQSGLGFEVVYMQDLGHYWGMIDAMIMIGLVGYGMNWLLETIEEGLLGWR